MPRRQARTQGLNDPWTELTGEKDVPDSVTRNLSASDALELRVKNAGQAEINGDVIRKKNQNALGSRGGNALRRR